MRSFNLFKSSESNIFDIKILKEFKNALLMYLSREKLVLKLPVISMLSTTKTFSLEKVFEKKPTENIVAVKIIKIYSLNLLIK